MFIEDNMEKQINSLASPQIQVRNMESSLQTQRVL